MDDGIRSEDSCQAKAKRQHHRRESEYDPKILPEGPPDAIVRPSRGDHDVVRPRRRRTGEAENRERNKIVEHGAPACCDASLLADIPQCAISAPSWGYVEHA